MAKLTKAEISRFQAQPHICYACHRRFATDKEVRMHPCSKADQRKSKEARRTPGHTWLKT
jgi:hypothetical protein